MAQNVTLLGASYSDVPAVLLPKTGGGTARFTDASITTAVEADVASGKKFIKADGSTGTGSATAAAKAAQITNANGRVASSSYVDTGVSLTVGKAGTYDIYWSAFRTSTSGTSGTRLYKNGSAQGTAQTSWENSYVQNPHLSMSLSANDVLKIYARSRSGSYTCCVSDLMIIEQ